MVNHLFDAKNRDVQGFAHLPCAKKPAVAVGKKVMNAVKGTTVS